MTSKDHTVHISFYEEGTEQRVGECKHAQVPRAGDRVWLDSRDDDGVRTFGCWEIKVVVWSYTDPASYDGLRGNMGGMVDILVTRSEGIFR